MASLLISSGMHSGCLNTNLQRLQNILVINEVFKSFQGDDDFFFISFYNDDKIRKKIGCREQKMVS